MNVDERSRLTAQKDFAANVSPRARKLDMLERYARGTQYEGRPSFWDDSVPLPERAPYVVMPVAERAAESNVDLCFGEGRAPTFALQANADTVFDERFGLSEVDADLATKFIGAVCEQADFISASADLLLWAQLHGTTCAVTVARNGRLCVEREDAKWCTPTFDANDPELVTKLEIRYPYLEAYTNNAGQLSWRCMLYRRVIDDRRDVTYVPSPASDRGQDPDQWIEDPAKVAEHGLGFCPVTWYRFGVRGYSRELDGRAIHATMCDEIDALNLGLSQIHRAAVYATDPQIIETGVDPSHQQAPMGRTASIWMPGDTQTTGGDIIRGPNGESLGSNPIAWGNDAWRLAPSGRERSAARRGPGVTWRYPDSESKVDLLTLPGDALKPAEDNAMRLYSLIKEMLGVVFLDPEQTKLGSDISGRALEWLHSKQIDRCNRIRKDFARRMMIPVLHTLLRVALRTQGALYIPGLDKARKVLERFEQEVEGAVGPRWFGPEIRVTWGPYFKPTATDAKQDTENAIAAREAGLITTKDAVETIKPYYPSIGDVSQHMKELDEEAKAKSAKFHEAAAALTRGAEQKPEEDDAQEQEEPVSARRPVTRPPGEPRPPKAKKPPVVRAKERVREQPAAPA